MNSRFWLAKHRSTHFTLPKTSLVGKFSFLLKLPLPIWRDLPLSRLSLLIPETVSNFTPGNSQDFGPMHIHTAALEEGLSPPPELCCLAGEPAGAQVPPAVAEGSGGQGQLQPGPGEGAAESACTQDAQSSAGPPTDAQTKALSIQTF